MSVTGLSVIEVRELEQYEAVIERGLKTFEEVGNALLAIRDKRLYSGYDTFEDYCRERWGLGWSHAHRLMDAARVMDNLKTSPMGDVSPQLERHVRPLAPLAPDQQREAWQRAVDTAPNGKVTGAHVAQIAAEYKPRGVEHLNNPATWHRPDAYRTPSEPSVHYSSESPEWYTPGHIIERVTAVLGAIDLDPCSNPGTPNVPARQHYTEKDNGLSHEWRGRVYMNPPYGRVIGEWVSHLVSEYEAGRVTEAIALVPARTDTEWFGKLRQFPRCFIRGRLSFSEHDNTAPFPSVAVYLGDDLPTFVAAFRDLGDTYKLVGD